MSFQDRAFGRIRDLARSGIPVVIVSHQLDRIAELCTDAILLNKGEAIARGTPNDVIAAYVESYNASLAVAGKGIVTYDDVQLSSTDVCTGDRFTLSVRGRILQPVANTFDPLRVRVRSLANGTVVFATGSQWLNLDFASPGAFSVDMDLQANLPQGNYSLEVDAVDGMGGGKNVDAAPGIALRITSPTRFLGSVALNPTVRVAG
jgi:hypothetical protein